MKTILNRTLLSSQDFRRLKESFFSSSPHQASPSHTNIKKKVIMTASLAFVVLLIGFAFFSNFDIVILSNPNHIFGNDAIDLLSKEELATASIIAPAGNSKIAKKLILVDIPFDRKAGFSLNFKDKMDMSDSNVALVLKNPGQDFNIDVVLRDNRFFSNSLNPITLEVSGATETSEYIKVPINIEHSNISNINLLGISQLRFVFSQKKEDSLPVFVKNVLYEKRR
ncbi:MAG: hypothetical protein JW869_06985 [Candidatus Omnitrophica bacterium]|nr:hypothetical protein [Candidatus Omnitrophota bacterium]